VANRVEIEMSPGFPGLIIVKGSAGPSQPHGSSPSNGWPFDRRESLPQFRGPQRLGTGQPRVPQDGEIVDAHHVSAVVQAIFGAWAVGGAQPGNHAAVAPDDDPVAGGRRPS